MSPALAQPDDSTSILNPSLAQQTEELIQNSRSSHTKLSYRSDWNDFVTWCQTRGDFALPASPVTVGQYLTYLALHRRLKASTIQRRMSSISQAHKMKGHPSPIGSEHVRSVWKGIKRNPHIMVKQEGKKPILIDDLRNMVAALEQKQGLNSLRDRALLLLGFSGAFRRSELVALNVEDIEETREGLVITIRHSKTDQEGRGRRIALPYGSRYETCPVRTYKLWLEKSNITSGPVFRRMDKAHRIYPEPLSDRAVARIVKMAAERAGLDATQYAGHSLRAGFATSAARGGASERAIMDQRDTEVCWSSAAISEKETCSATTQRRMSGCEAVRLKVTKSKNIFPTDESLKMLYLVPSRQRSSVNRKVYQPDGE